MSAYRLSNDDEFPHLPSNEANFNESVYVNGFDLERRFGGWMRIGNRANEGHAEAQVCMYLPDGRIACQFQRPDIQDNQAFCAGGLEYQVLEPMRRVTMDYAGDVLLLDDPEMLRNPGDLFRRAPRSPARIHFELEACSPAHRRAPLSDTQQTMYGRDFSLGHFNQHTRTRASIEIAGESWAFDGFGWRDHSWGPRYWTNIYFYRLFLANFGPDRAIMILKITGRDGITRREGVLQYDGEYEEITDLDVMTDWTPAKDPKGIYLGIRTAQRAVTMRGEVLSLAPLRNRRKIGEETLQSRIAEGLTRWEWDGREGMGVTEYIEFLENGEPVGYPL
jgi:hypothetical protein